MILADGPVRVKDRGVWNRWQGDMGDRKYIVSVTVCYNSALLGCGLGRYGSGVALNDIVLDQWIDGPAVDGEIGSTDRVEAS